MSESAGVMRKAFERWVKREHLAHSDFRHDKDGYWSLMLDRWWQSWKVAWRISRRASKRSKG